MSDNEISFPGGSTVKINPDFNGLSVKCLLKDDDNASHVMGSMLRQVKEMTGDASFLEDLNLEGSKNTEKPKVLLEKGGRSGCLLGVNDFGRKYFNPDIIPNANGVVIGATGMGKTTLLRNMISQLDGIKIIFDPSGDMDSPGETHIPFHKESNYGINPLEVGIDPKSGGPRTQSLIISEFLESQFSSYGIRQMDVIRRIISILYELYGITDDHETWVKECPAMSDLINLVNFLVDLQVGRYFDALKDIRKAEDAYEVVQEQLSRFGWEEDESWIAEFQAAEDGTQSDEDKERYRIRATYDKDIRSAKKNKMKLEAAIHVFSGRIVDRLKISSLKHDGDKFKSYVNDFHNDGERLLGVKSMFDKLEESGIFGPDLPSFNTPGVYRIDMLYLETAPRQLLIETLMRNIMRDRQRIGHSHWKDRIFLFHDEAKDMLEKHKGNPFAITSRIAHQGRKYGIGYWCAGQSDKMIPIDLRGAFYTRIVMGSGGDALTIKGLSKTYNIDENAVREVEKGQALIGMGSEVFLKYDLLNHEGA